MSEVPDFMKEESNEVSSFKNTSLQTLGELADRIVGEQKKVRMKNFLPRWRK